MWINGMIIVDHLGLIKTEKSTEERQELLQRFSEMMKKLRERHGIDDLTYKMDERIIKIMKTLKDGTEVSSRSYYFLLDFNDVDGWKTMFENFGAMKLNELNIEQYIVLFEIATQKEIENLKK